MKSVLEALNQVAGVRGSMVVTHDGMVVASALSKALDRDTVAAVASTVVRKTLQALESAGFGTLRRYDMKSSHGRMVFVDTGRAYLIVVTEKEIDIGPVGIEIQSASRRIGQLCRVSI